MSRIVLHVDFDHFYAQCEETRKPLLRGVPLVICVFSGRGADSGAVATANYVARKYKVKSGISIKLARSRLAEVPEARFLPVDFAFYDDMSERAMGIMRSYADTFEYVGRDEAYLDITAESSGTYDVAQHIAQKIKNDIQSKLSMTCSIGISSTRLVSKIASAYHKPDGMTVVEPHQVKEFLAGLEVRDIPGLGKKAEESLDEMGITSIGELRSRDIFVLIERFGRHMGTYLHNAANGIDETPVSERAPNLQYSKIATLPHDSADEEFLKKSMMPLCTIVHKYLCENSRTFRTISVQLIQHDLEVKTRSLTLRNSASSLGEIESSAQTLLHDALDSKIPIRRIGVRVSELGESRGQRSMDDY